MRETIATTLALRVEPELKEALRAVAEQEHRPIANRVAVSIMDYCGRIKILTPEQENLSERSTKPKVKG